MQVAFEDFNLHMSKMYHQYEQQRTDDVVDPRERQQRPISTISGINDEEKPVPKSSVQISEITEDEAAALQKAGIKAFSPCVLFFVVTSFWRNCCLGIVD